MVWNLNCWLSHLANAFSYPFSGRCTGCYCRRCWFTGLSGIFMLKGIAEIPDFLMNWIVLTALQRSVFFLFQLNRRQNQNEKNNWFSRYKSSFFRQLCGNCRHVRGIHVQVFIFFIYKKRYSSSPRCGRTVAGRSSRALFPRRLYLSSDGFDSSGTVGRFIFPVENIPRSHPCSEHRNYAVQHDGNTVSSHIYGCFFLLYLYFFRSGNSRSTDVFLPGIHHGEIYFHDKLRSWNFIRDLFHRQNMLQRAAPAERVKHYGKMIFRFPVCVYCFGSDNIYYTAQITTIQSTAYCQSRREIR